ncbi:MAG: 30S ribosomal protein S18 [bacterium ADurb.Bin132]|jgi:small subunit ribosomal protein S18|nr:MAG: 30S ribosomal protein S18 [bacterium ADurb.Bin132]
MDKMMDDDRKGRRMGKGRKFSKPRRKVCIYCADHNDYVDYKDVARLQKYVTDTGKILPRRATGMCAKHQRRLCTAIKRAREIALLPFSAR